MFFRAKLRRFCADFPIIPVGAATCRPPKRISVFPLYTALCAVTIAALPIPRAADCRPYGNDRKIGAETTEFCVKKHLKQHIIFKYFLQQSLCSDKSRIYIMRHKQSPVNGKNIPFTGSDL